MHKQFDQPSWIFVSHSSDDIEQVRIVRNYLEQKGAAPLLFHLVALNDPEEFWPLIQREIEARNFFLYCESSSAEEREWVRRERLAVAEASQKRAVRIGSINVERPEIEYDQLDRFVAATKVYPILASRDDFTVDMFARELSRAGFQVFLHSQIALFSGVYNWRKDNEEVFAASARDGWVLFFLSQSSASSPLVMEEVIAAKKYAAKIIVVLLDAVELPSEVSSAEVFDATRDMEAAPTDLARFLLLRDL